MKDLVKRKPTQPQEQNRALAKHQKQDIKPFEKKLNMRLILGLLGVYTLVTLLIGSNMTTNEQDHLASYEKLIDKTNRAISSLEDRLYKEQNKPDKTIMIKTIERKLNAKIDKFNHKIDDYEDKLIKKEREIASLKQNIQDMKVMLDEKDKKVEKKEEVLVYNYQNYSLLHYDHRKALERLQNKVDARIEAYEKLLDLSKAEDREKLQDYKDKMDRKVYKLKMEQVAERRKLVKEKILVRN
jgi:chromosome segregation ATPase